MENISLQNIIFEQLKSSVKKQKTARIIKIVAVVVISILIAFVGAVVICAETGQKWAVGIERWISDNYGVTIGVGALTALAVVGKYIASINVSNSNNENLLAKVIDYVVESNTETAGSLHAMADRLSAVSGEIMLQPETLKSIKDSVDTATEMQTVLYQLFKLWSEKQPPDRDVQNLFAQFTRSQLFRHAAALTATEEEAPARVETPGEVIRKTAVSGERPRGTIKAIKKGPGV